MTDPPSSVPSRYTTGLTPLHLPRGLWSPEPRLLVDVQTADGTFRAAKFLVDTGAAVSAIPMSLAELLKIPFDRRQRMDFSGIGVRAVEAHLNHIVIRLCGVEHTIPCLIYRSEDIFAAFLGRSWFFERFDLHLSDRELAVELREPGRQ